MEWYPLHILPLINKAIGGNCVLDLDISLRWIISTPTIGRLNFVKPSNGSGAFLGQSAEIRI